MCVRVCVSVTRSVCGFLRVFTTLIRVCSRPAAGRSRRPANCGATSRSTPGSGAGCAPLRAATSRSCAPSTSGATSSVTRARSPSGVLSPVRVVGRNHVGGWVRWWTWTNVGYSRDETFRQRAFQRFSRRLRCALRGQKQHVRARQEAHGAARCGRRPGDLLLSVRRVRAQLPQQKQSASAHLETLPRYDCSRLVCNPPRTHKVKICFGFFGVVRVTAAAFLSCYVCESCWSTRPFG